MYFFSCYYRGGESKVHVNDGEGGRVQRKLHRHASRAVIEVTI